MTRLLFFIFTLLLPITSFAAIDDYVVKQWNIQSGLPSQSVKSVVQDNQGYIWLGTQFGLSRFDGHQFQNFNTQNTEFLNSNAINKLVVDRFGMLWVGTRRGLLRLNPQTLEARRFDLQGPVRDILQDEDGGIWIAANGLYYVSAKKLTLAANNIEQSTLDVTQINQIVGSVTKMALVPDGIWLVNERHLLKISESSNRTGDGVRLELASKVSLPEQLAQTIIHDLAWVDGKLFLASELGAYFLDIDEVLRRYQEVGNNAVYKFLNDKEGGLWVSTYGRLLYRQNNGIWQAVEPIQLDQSIWFADIFMDNDNNIWLASLNEGLWLAHSGKVERHHIGQRTNQAISAITQGPNGQLWVASREGLGIIGLNDSYQPVLTSAQLNRSVIHDLEFIGEKLILGTDRGALIYEDGTLQKLSERELRQNPVFSLSPSNRGGMWFGTGRGLYRLDYKGITPFAYNAFLGSQFVTFVEDFPRYGFIGTNKGAYRYNDKGIEKIGSQTSLDTAYITSILHLDTVTTLVGSLNDGLFYRTSDGDWYQLDASNGLPYGSIFSLHYDKSNQLIWVSTMKGVYRMPVAQFGHVIESLQVEQVISPFDRQLDGRPSQCCSGLGHDAVVETESAIFYPSLQGVVEIPKNVQLFGGGDLLPRLESLSTHDRVFSTESLNQVIQLDTSERDLTINYTAIDFYAPHSIEFRYKLEGHDTQWRDAQSRREAIYTNLPPGNFTFVLEVKRQGQDWEQAKVLNLSITLPRRFDETIYFRLFITCAFIFMFYLIFWVFRAQERRKQAALEALIAERTTELRKANEKLNQVNTQLKLVSHSDELTGLRSRRFLFDQLPKDVEHYQRNAQSLQAQNKSLVLMIMNIDDFSKINDSYGPIGGDSCLQQLATLLNTRTQGSDYVVRWSGDEFLLLLRDFSRDYIEEYVSDLCKAIAETDYRLPNGKTTKLTVSMGWSYYPLPLLGGKVIGWESSVNLADIALHQVKQRGGDGAATIIFDDQLDAFEFEQSANIESQLQLLQSNGLAEVRVWMR
ncbi:ligand-binding sensor domain-containing diguanylate cyclase [Pseudoalteromonas piscicida]|uniref:ligand-binding sensor domain-containing diguanylate cyclase n=1 Tax=Pseudoalteromonas piscicida TaxID=43662 RepID=UPI001C93D064|nr:ligand-binding sensor domain-containing diguanylate cyclase [Pseudoalteromonas piscicida]QZO12124.1 diguanylate cyclase [Pseudoalteromonas piscicida]